MNISKETIDNLANGDHKAFHQVFKVAYPKVYAFAIGFIKDKNQADDITQNVFINLWTHRETLPHIQNLDSYLYKVTKNMVLNFIASQKAFTIDITAARDIKTNETTALEQLEAQDLQLLTDMIVENMPPQRQAVYRLSRIQGLSNDEIAEKLGLQKKTVENHLNLALGDIRKMLKIFILLLLNWG